MAPMSLAASGMSGAGLCSECEKGLDAVTASPITVER
jgi:hypothetical protein